MRWNDERANGSREYRKPRRSSTWLDGFKQIVVIGEKN